MDMARSFARWLKQNAALLHGGHELLLPLLLPHPGALGFKQTVRPHFGQVRDWTLALRRDRLVVHELAHGQCIIRLERPSSRGAAVLVSAGAAGARGLAAVLVALGGVGLSRLGRR